MSSPSRGFVAVAVAVAVCLLVALPVFAYFVGRSSVRNVPPAVTPPTIVRDTTWVHDTITLLLPVPDPVFIEVPPVEVPIIDSGIIIFDDSLSIPRIQQHYSDSAYDAWVSGYLPQLDSIKLYPKTAVITNTVEVEAPPRKLIPRLSMGVQAGIGASKDGLSPYIGIGISYNILSFWFGER